MPPPPPDLHGVPIDYLEAYPLPAFLIQVRAPRNVNQPPVRPPLRVRNNTDVTIRSLKRPERNERQQETTADNVRMSRSPSVSSVSSYASGWSRGHSASITEDDESAWVTATNPLVTPTVTTPESSANSSRHTTSNGGIPSANGSPCIPGTTNNPPAPVSAPLSSCATLVWENSHATAITHGRPLHDIVEPHSLAILQSWAETVPESDPNRAHSSASSPIFSIEIGHPPVSLDLVKTRQPVGPDDEFALVVLTATKSVTPAPRTEDPLLAKSPHLGPDLRAGPQPLDPHSGPQGTPGMIFSSEGTRLSEESKGDQDVEQKRLHVLAHSHLLHSTDWSNSPIGPPESWPREIRSMINIAFSSYTMDCIFIGPDFHMVYNQRYSAHVDHPNSFGQPAATVWAPLWEDLRPVLTKAMGGEPVSHLDNFLLHRMDSRGRYIEWYHSYSLIPILDPDNKVIGIYNPSIDTTERVLAKRRLATTQALIEQVSVCRVQGEFFDAVAQSLEPNSADAPFAICYSVREKDPSTSRDGLMTVELNLRSTVGVPEGHSCAPAKLNVSLPKAKPAAYRRRTSTSTTRSTASPAFSPAMGISERLGEPSTTVTSPKAFERAHSGSSVHSFLSQSMPMEIMGSRDRLSSTPSKITNKSPSVSSSMTLGSVPVPSTPPPGRRSLLQAESSQQPNQPVAWPIARALATRQCVVVEDCSELIQGLPIRQWTELPDVAMVIPICTESSSSAHLPAGVLILGLNRYHPLDAKYDEWIQVLRAHLATTLSSVIAYEADVARQSEKEALDRAKAAWFRGSAREFRTPLTLITGPLEDLQRTHLSNSQQQQLGMALKNVHRLQQLVTCLLDFTRMEAGQVQPRFICTDLSQLVVDIAGVFRTAIERLRLEFKVAVQPPPAIEYGVDPVLLEMLLSNLLLVSLKKTKRGGITVDLRYEGSWAILSVTDTGSGVHAEPLDSLADVIGRYDTSGGPGTTDNDHGLEGTAIGLAVAQEIMRLHGGTVDITCQSEEENPLHHGSKFTARIPLVQPQHDESLVLAPRGAYARNATEEIVLWNDEAGPAGSYESHHSLDSLSKDLVFEPTDRLLVVDGCKSIRDYIKNIFERFCNVIDVGSVAEALETIAECQPDLILCDEDSLDNGGLLGMIRSHPQTKVTPVVALSSSNDDESRLAAFIAGADDFIPKPFKSRELLLRVHLHMQMGKKQASLEKLFAAREQEIAVLSDYCPSGIMRTDADGRLTYANAAFLESAGIRPDEEFDDWTSLCDYDSWADVEDKWEKIMNGDETTTKIQWKWNTGRTMSGVFIRLDKLNPSLSGIIGCVTDISYQEERLVEAERRRQEAEESRQQQELLVDLISHEIRTPVSAILQCSSVVKDNLVALRHQLRFTGNGGFRPSAELLTELEEDVAALDSIFQCGLVQERIAGDVLSFARIQLDMLSLHDVEMDLRPEARKVMSVFSTEARMKKINIKLLFAPTLDLLGIHSIKTDPVRLGQVVTNLISNAIRFTSNSDVREITVTYNVSYDPPTPGSYECPGSGQLPARPDSPVAEDTPVYLYVSVRDTGPGMSPKEKDVLFQRFHQGNKMIHTRYGGSGLGLFICRKITELLGGGIEVQSQLGKGSVFNFYIKACSVSPSSALEAQSAGPSSSTFSAVSRGGISRENSDSSQSTRLSLTFSSPVSTASRKLTTPPDQADKGTPPDQTEKGSQLIENIQEEEEGHEDQDKDRDDARPLHVLIVEDNIINQTVLKRQILKAGLTCDTANHGQDALNLIHQAHHRYMLGERDRAGYDVILMDLEMPVMDGLSALAKIREAEAEGQLKEQLVIALTGNARKGQIDQAIKAGMNDVVIKPYRLPELIAKMEAMVRDRKEEAARA